MKKYKNTINLATYINILKEFREIENSPENVKYVGVANCRRLKKVYINQEKLNVTDFLIAGYFIFLHNEYIQNESIYNNIKTNYFTYMVNEISNAAKYLPDEQLKRFGIYESYEFSFIEPEQFIKHCNDHF